jgi:hypothetical protein
MTRAYPLMLTKAEMRTIKTLIELFQYAFSDPNEIKVMERVLYKLKQKEI